jgi:3-oxoisoapionate decarboxylase
MIVPQIDATGVPVEITPIEVHVHSFSMRHHLRSDPAFDVFAYLSFAADHGFTGVNISANGPGFRDLGGTTAEHFADVRASLAEHDLRCELDTSDTRTEHLTRMLHVAEAVGADQLRVYTRYSGTLAELQAWTVRDLREVAPVAEDLGIRIVLENHEDFQGRAIAEILAAVDHPNVRALYDYGNSQMVGEDPLDALDEMLPWITAVHVKDHVVIDDGERRWVQGVAIGDGLLPIAAQTRRLADGGLRRFCFENVWGYVAPMLVDTIPPGPSFSLDHPHRLMRSDDLPIVDAIRGERAAFERAWAWWRASLASDGFEIRRAVVG